jgi:hypothetical protein
MFIFNPKDRLFSMSATQLVVDGSAGAIAELARRGRAADGAKATKSKPKASTRAAPTRRTSRKLPEFTLSGLPGTFNIGNLIDLGFGDITDSWSLKDLYGRDERTAAERAEDAAEGFVDVPFPVGAKHVESLKGWHIPKKSPLYGKKSVTITRIQ